MCSHRKIGNERVAMVRFDDCDENDWWRMSWRFHITREESPESPGLPALLAKTQSLDHHDKGALSIQTALDENYPT